MTKFSFSVSNPTNTPSDFKLTKEDVWGKYKESKGMIIAKADDVCPIWGDVIPFKSVTVKCRPEQMEEVIYWLEYVHGGDSITKSKTLDDGTIALRSDYQCW